MPNEARKHPRHQIEARADILGQEIAQARTIQDISVDGCRIDRGVLEASGGVVDLVISFPALDTHLAVRGEIMHKSEDSTGIRFRLANEDQRWALRKCIRESLEPQGADAPHRTGS